MANIKISQLPAKGANLGAQDLVEVAEFTGTGYVSKSITGQEIIDAASGGGAAWGSITGTLSTQTDLQTALDAKQDDLISGTNIKTINSTSVLGSGNIAVQDTLVSGTNIKTINGSSVLGSGNLTIGSSGLQGVHNLLGNQISTSFGIMPCLNAGSLTNFSITAGNLYLVPFIPNKTITSVSLKINVVIAGVGAIARILVYSDLNAFPRSVLYQSSNLDCSTTGIKSATTAFTFTAGTTYWLAVQVGTSNITLNGITTSALVPIFNFGFVNPYVGYYTSGLTIGTPPDPYSLYAYYNTAAPAIFISLS